MRQYRRTKETQAMVTSAQKAFFTSLAGFARATASLLDEMGSADPTTPEPVKAAEPKPAKVAKVAAAPAPVEHKPPPVATTPPPAVNGTEGGDLQAQCRKAAKAYAEVYGREGLKEVLKKFTEGTLADVTAAQLPDLFKALS